MKRIVIVLISSILILGCAQQQPVIQGSTVGIAVKVPPYFSIANFGDIAYRSGYVPVISGVNSASLQQKKYEQDFTNAVYRLYGTQLFQDYLHQSLLPILHQCGFMVKQLDPALYSLNHRKKSLFITIFQKIFYLGGPPEENYTLPPAHDAVTTVLILNADWGYNTFSHTYPLSSAPFRPAVYLQALILSPEGIKKGKLTQIATGYDEKNALFTFSDELMIMSNVNIAVEGILFYYQQALLELGQQICQAKT